MRITLVAMAAVLTVACSTYFLLQDEALLPEVQAMVHRAEPSKASRAYTYLLGLHSPAGSNPEISGLEMLKRVRQHERTHLSDPAALDGPGISITYDNPLANPDGPLFCHFTQPGCLTSLFQSAELITVTLNQNQELFQRWQTFSLMDDFQVLTRPSLAEPFPPYHYMLKANRLTILNSIGTARKGDPADALEQMLSNLKPLRRLLVQDSHLVGKMVAVQLLSNQLDAINALMIRYDLELRSPLPSLSLQEKSLDAAMGREMAGAVRLYRQMNGRTDLLSETSEMPAWAVQFLFKPDKTNNALHPVYRDSVTASELQPAEFVTYLKQTPTPQPRPNWISNPVGTILNRVAMPDMRQYAGRVHDLDVKIRLFNAMHQTTGKSLSDTANQFTNPYYPDDVISVHDIRAGSICLEGPLADNSGIRCLKGFLQSTDNRSAQ